MRIWFHRVAALLGFEEAQEESVRAVLELAARRSASIGISDIDGVAQPTPLCGFVSEIEDECFVISRPTTGTERKPLAMGEHLHISIGADQGFFHGDTMVLGRFTEINGHTRRYGYRLSFPKALVHEERRNLHRVPVAFDLAPSAELTRINGGDSVGRGTVLDLSEGGLRVRLAATVLIRKGDCLRLRAQFPATIEDFDGRVTVAHVAPSRTGTSVDLGLRFLDEQTQLAQQIRALEIRRIQRPGLTG
ncbi:MAG: PilZ domain-containing protein [Phycisphaerales bacterium]|nr:PilZ domain-containing protein [Phycisphaerales bacterium]